MIQKQKCVLWIQSFHCILKKADDIEGKTFNYLIYDGSEDK